MKTPSWIWIILALLMVFLPSNIEAGLISILSLIGLILVHEKYHKLPSKDQTKSVQKNIFILEDGVVALIVALLLSCVSNKIISSCATGVVFIIGVLMFLFDLKLHKKH